VGTVGRDGAHAEASMQPTHPAPPAIPPLAGAFLALADQGETLDRTPALSTLLAAAAAAVVLALSAPLAWATGPVSKPSDQPAATAASKAAVPAPDDDGADGGV
jgi:hypothetical protein